MTEKLPLTEISKYVPLSDSLRFKDDRSYGYLNSVLGGERSSTDPKMTESIMNTRATNQCIVPATTATVYPPKASNDLLQFIEKQEGYIEQLERESQFCRVFHLFFTRFLIWNDQDYSNIEKLHRLTNA